jgi:hypothetical protein
MKEVAAKTDKNTILTRKSLPYIAVKFLVGFWAISHPRSLASWPVSSPPGATPVRNASSSGTSNQSVG